MILSYLLIFTALSFGIVLMFTYESFREQESRAFKVGAFSGVVILAAGTAVFLYPVLRIPYSIFATLLIFSGLLFSLPIKTKSRSTLGAMGYAEGKISRFDQRDTVFSRNRSLKPGTKNYQEYYQKYPEKEKKDAKRRQVGGLLGNIGKIDDEYKANVELIKTSPNLAGIFEPHASGIQISESAKSHLSF